jgi:hypothetical protein
MVEAYIDNLPNAIRRTSKRPGDNREPRFSASA